MHIYKFTHTQEIDAPATPADSPSKGHHYLGREQGYGDGDRESNSRDRHVQGHSNEHGTDTFFAELFREDAGGRAEGDGGGGEKRNGDGRGGGAQVGEEIGNVSGNSSLEHDARHMRGGGMERDPHTVSVVAGLEEAQRSLFVSIFIFLALYLSPSLSLLLFARRYLYLSCPFLVPIFISLALCLFPSLSLLLFPCLHPYRSLFLLLFPISLALCVSPSLSLLLFACLYLYLSCSCSTGWQRLIGPFIFIGHFPQK